MHLREAVSSASIVAGHKHTYGYQELAKISLIYTDHPQILISVSNYLAHPLSNMQIASLFTLLGLQALITTTLAQSALLERQFDDAASCLDTYYNTAYCCSDTIADCDDGTFPKPHYLNLKLRADLGVLFIVSLSVTNLDEHLAACKELGKTARCCMVDVCGISSLCLTMPASLLCL
jgi:hypothetical protein